MSKRKPDAWYFTFTPSQVATLQQLLEHVEGVLAPRSGCNDVEGVARRISLDKVHELQEYITYVTG